MADFSSENIQ